MFVQKRSALASPHLELSRYGPVSKNCSPVPSALFLDTLAAVRRSTSDTQNLTGLLRLTISGSLSDCQQHSDSGGSPMPCLGHSTRSLRVKYHMPPLLSIKTGLIRSDQ